MSPSTCPPQVDGKPVEDAQATGVSYEIGSGTMLDGLDEALEGLSADETATFQTELAGGAAGGQPGRCHRHGTQRQGQGPARAR